MKSINILCISLSIVIGLAILQVPLISNGTAVIYSMTNDGKNGNQPFTVAVPDLTTNQSQLLSFAYEVAKADGFLHPAFLQGILMQESRGCSVKNFRVAGLTNKPNDRYFGCGQIKLATAKTVLAKYPELWKYLESRTDEELQARLILDDQFNIRVASKYVLMMGINENPGLAITAYNTGPAGAKGINPATFYYTASVKQHSEKMTKRQVSSHIKKNILVASDDVEWKSHQKILLARDP